MSDYSHEDVKELSDRLRLHCEAIEEELKTEPESDELREALEDAEEAIEEIAPVLGVDDEDLPKYEAILDDARETEEEVAELLKK